MVRLGWNRGVGLLVALAALSGCYDWARVRPTELPKLNAGARELETADGGRFAVHRRVTAKVSTPYGDVKVGHPRADIADGLLTIEGDDGVTAHIPLDQITSVQVGQVNVIDTTASFIVLGAAVVATVLLYSWMRPDMSGGVK